MKAKAEASDDVLNDESFTDFLANVVQRKRKKVKGVEAEETAG